MKHPWTVTMAISLLACAVATAHADDHGRHDGARHQQSAHQSHGRQPGNVQSRNFHSMPAHDHARNSRPGYSGRQGLSAGYNGRHDWDGRRGFDNVHFGPHRFVDPYASRGFSPGRGFYGNRYTRYRADRYFPPYGYRSYAWRRGDRLPVAYYAPRYIVRDYRAYHLGVPPLGYYWVRVNNDVLLTAITTGVVLQVVNDVFW